MFDRTRWTLLATWLLLSGGCAGCEETVTPMDASPDPPDMVQDLPPDAPIDLPEEMTPDASPDLPTGCDDALRPCPRGQACVDAVCEPRSCDTLTCAPTERCETLDDGAVCEDNTCVDSNACPEDRFCDPGGLCAPDVCVPSTATCGGQTLEVCAADGGGTGLSLTCPLRCEDGVVGQAPACVCRDDWECPEFTRCEAGLCQGSGRPPECTLDPVPFDQARPTLEMAWGTDTTTDFPNPYPEYSHVSQTALVANLDDDNGDGVINELDFPEIVFIGARITDPFDTSAPRLPSVLRVVRGGGPERGKTVLAICGDQVWREGDAVDGLTCDVAPGPHYRVYGTSAVGDLDGDGTPEIVTMFIDPSGGSIRVRLLSPTGDILLDSDIVDTRNGDVGSLGLTLADVDADGTSEILIGAHLLTVAKDASGTWSQTGSFSPGALPLFVACVGDFSAASPGQEWFDQNRLWRKPAKPADRATRADCDGTETDDAAAWCNQQLVLVWDKSGELGALNGLCAVADVWGAAGAPNTSADLDGVPEIVIVDDGELAVLAAESGDVLLRQDLSAIPGSTAASLAGGGAPNIDDFDGDGLPEIGSAFSERYVVMDLQPTTAACEAWTADTRPAPSEACTPGSCDAGSFCDASGAAPVCRCRHNSWVKVTEDQSSRRTGSSVFDFNGDGAAEVVYNDECFFRVYDGRDGATLFEQPSEHITNIEYPVIADVDNDGNAEIVFSSTSQGLRCSVRGQNNPDSGQPYSSDNRTGIQVWGDASDAWVSARRIWNQHAYAVTAVYEDARIPREPLGHWTDTTQGRLYNTYRSNPRSLGLAPDLIVTDVRVSSPQGGCSAVSTTLQITGRVENRGDLRVGPGVALVVRGRWAGGREKLLRDGMGDPLVFVNQQSLEPLRSVRFELTYDALLDGETMPPEALLLEVDPTDPAVLASLPPNVQSERECLETNNVTEVAIMEQALPDLEVVSVSTNVNTCPRPGVTAEVANRGGVPVEGVSVSFYAGPPDLGGRLLGTAERPERLGPGETAAIFANLDFEALTLLGVPVRIHAVARPLQDIDECNLSNNLGIEPGEAVCQLN